MARTPFAPRVSLVTGGAAGIGRALAVELGRRGSRVVIADIDAAAAERTAAELRADGLTVTTRGVDVADATAMDDLVREVVATEGRLDAMVNNAGILVNGRSRSSTTTTGAAPWTSTCSAWSTTPAPRWR